jgi:ferritin-like metal-binding protein YciE
VEFNSLTDVLIEELGDLYSSEQQLLATLPTLAAAAHSYDLREIFETHTEETRDHLERLEVSFSEMGVRFAPTRTSRAMQGLLADSVDIANSGGDPVALDAALIGAAQRIEQYEIALYGTARALAGELGLGQTSSTLDQTLSDETKANKALAKLATGGFMSGGINRIAAERSAQADAEIEVVESTPDADESEAFVQAPPI